MPVAPRPLIILASSRQISAAARARRPAQNVGSLPEQFCWCRVLEQLLHFLHFCGAMCARVSSKNIGNLRVVSSSIAVLLASPDSVSDSCDRGTKQERSVLRAQLAIIRTITINIKIVDAITIIITIAMISMVNDYCHHRCSVNAVPVF